MVQDFMESARLDSIIEEKKAKGELSEFTAREVVKLSARVEKLPCLNDQECPPPKHPKLQSATRYAERSGIGFGVASVIYWLIQFFGK